MTNPSQAQSPSTRPLAPLPHQRSRRLLLVLATALSAMTLSGVSLAASSPSPKAHQASKAPARHAAPAQRSKTHPSATSPKSKQPQALHQTQRKTPAKARLAAKSKAPKRAHQSPGKPAKLTAKNPKPAA
jgi:hypothetical protein